MHRRTSADLGPVRSGVGVPRLRLTRPLSQLARTYHTRRLVTKKVAPRGPLDGKTYLLAKRYHVEHIVGTKVSLPGIAGGVVARKREYPPVLVSTAEIKLQVSRDVKAGRLRKLGPRLYTPNVVDEPAAVVQRNLWEVVGLLFPETVVAYRTAIEGKPSPEGTVNLVGSYDRLLELPGVTVRQIKGPGPLEGDRRFLKSLWLASRARAFLECLRPSRVTAAGSRGLPREEIERRIERLVRVSGEEAVNQLRDEARSLAGELEAQSEFDELNDIIGSILGSQTGALTSPVALARATGEPYDPQRLERFQELHGALLDWPATPRPMPHQSAAAFENAAFVDAYFSNYIEGTEFGVEEAIEIVFQGRIPERRPEDAHDVLGTFRIVASRNEMGYSLSGGRYSAEDLFSTLRRRHEVITAGRPNTRPGEFKTQANFAGATAFVEPELVVGTLRRGFELFRSLREPFARAAFMMFLISEVHPFLDGNGRIARIMTNAELLAEGQQRIIIPTVYREDYLLALRSLTREGRTEAFLRMLDRAQEFVSRIDFRNMDAALATLRRANAFAEPSEARLIMPPEDAHHG